MFDAAPQSFDEYVVKSSSPAIHADGNFLAFEHAREGPAGELRLLVRVEYLGRAEHAQRVLQVVHVKAGVHAVADAPAQDLLRVPVDDGHQARKASGPSGCR